MSQRELARRVGIGETPVGRILNGDAEPKPDTLIAMCQALEVHPSWVLMGIEPAYLEGESGDLPARAHWGIDAWIAESLEGRNANEDERAWLRAVPWPAPHVRYPDMVYAMVLLSYRQAVATSQSSAALQPVGKSTEHTKRVG